MPTIANPNDAGHSVKAGIVITADSSLLLAAATGRRLMGYSVSTTAGSAARGNLLLGAIQSPTGTNLVAGFALIQDTSIDVSLGEDGVLAPDGVSVDFVSGSFSISLRYRDDS